MEITDKRGYISNMEPKDLFPYLQAHSKETVYKKLTIGTINALMPYTENGNCGIEFLSDVNEMVEAYLEVMDKKLADYNFMKDLQEKLTLVMTYLKD